MFKKITLNFLESKYIYNFISLLCATLVPLLVTGPFLSDFLVSALSLWFLYYTIKNKVYYIYKNKYFYFFLAFCSVCILSSLLSDNILFSLKSSLFYFRIGIFALLISYLIDKNKNILNYFYYFLVITFSILIIDGYLQYFSGKNILGNRYVIVDSNHSPRISSFFGDETILDSYLSRLFPLLFALFVIRKKNLIEVCFISFLFIFVDVLIYLGGSRTSFFFLNLSTIFIIIFIAQYKMLRLITFSVSFLIVILLTINDNRLLQRFIKMPLQSMGLENQESKKYIFTPMHDSHIKTALNMFIENPILGVGPRLFRIKCSDMSYAVGETPCNTHPHNFYIQLAAETGFIGLSFILGFFFYFLYLVIKHTKLLLFNKKLFLSDYQICLLSGVLITIWPFSPNGNFFNNHLMLFYILTIAFLKKLKKNL
jgi:hypothetical protein